MPPIITGRCGQVNASFPIIKGISFALLFLNQQPEAIIAIPTCVWLLCGCEQAWNPAQISRLSLKQLFGGAGARSPADTGRPGGRIPGPAQGLRQL